MIKYDYGKELHNMLDGTSADAARTYPHTKTWRKVMSQSRPKWMIFENAVYHWLSVRGPDGLGNLPDLKSCEEVEAFIADLREAAERVFPGEES